MRRYICMCAWYGMNANVSLINEFLGLEISAKVEHLPCGQAKQTAHAEHAVD